jgi:predicted metal-dependent hydrolase
VNSLVIEGKEVVYEIRPSRRARRLGLTVYPGGRLVLTIPPHSDEKRVIHFLHSHREWISKSIRRFENKKKLPGGLKDFKANKEKARAIIESRIADFNTKYGFRVGRITIRNNRSRWGSCSRKGDLSFSYKIVHLSKSLQDYIVVHELAHLKHFDHSDDFWRTVAETIPDYKPLRRELRSFVH